MIKASFRALKAMFRSVGEEKVRWGKKKPKQTCQSRVNVTGSDGDVSRYEFSLFVCFFLWRSPTAVIQDGEEVHSWEPWKEKDELLGNSFQAILEKKKGYFSSICLTYLLILRMTILSKRLLLMLDFTYLRPAVSVPDLWISEFWTFHLQDNMLTMER